jgi:signal transduction histidine kinase/CheY-like chemotaxis protein
MSESAQIGRMAQQEARPADTVDLESVLITTELGRRPSRLPDFEAENRILVGLTQEMARSPEAILHSLAQAALASCRAGSAGISLIADDGTFRRHALAGELSAHKERAAPRGFSPCAMAADRNATLLFSYPQRHFGHFAEQGPVIAEILLVPFCVEGTPVGTIWVASHDPERHFDGEDVRLLGSFGSFAAGACQLRSALAETEAAARHKDELLAVLSHELRNPLAAIGVAAELLACRPGADDEVSRATGILQRQVMILDRLIDDASDVARIGGGKLALRKERVALSRVVEDAIEVSRPAIDAGRHSLAVALPAGAEFVEVDRVRLTQVISNLLTNAAKFTRSGGHLRVSAQAQGAEAVVRVQDDGIGIPAGMLDGIFDLYAQIQPADGAALAGLGIGLTLARSLVELHGGSLAAHSAGPDQGSEFVVRLPLSGPPHPSVAISARPPPPHASLRVLVVDDHRDTADALAWVLQSIGHEARAVYDGPSALRAVDEQAPDLIIQDLGMPRMSGYEVARQLRRHMAARDAFLVAVSGHPPPAQEMADAFHHFLAKPVGLTALQAVLRTASSRRGSNAAPPAD